MSFVWRWCLLHKNNIFYCRSYSSKKGAKFNLQLLRKHPLAKVYPLYFNNFYIGLREVFE